MVTVRTCRSHDSAPGFELDMMTVMSAVKSEFDLSSTESIVSPDNNCTDYGLYTASISEAICTLIVFTLLILVVCVYKAYKTTLQRLVLYHVIFSLFGELSLLSLILYCSHLSLFVLYEFVDCIHHCCNQLLIDLHTSTIEE